MNARFPSVQLRDISRSSAKKSGLRPRCTVERLLGNNVRAGPTLNWDATEWWCSRASRVFSRLMGAPSVQGNMRLISKSLGFCEEQPRPAPLQRSTSRACSQAVGDPIDWVSLSRDAPLPVALFCWLPAEAGSQDGQRVHGLKAALLGTFWCEYGYEWYDFEVHVSID